MYHITLKRGTKTVNKTIPAIIPVDKLNQIWFDLGYTVVSIYFVKE